VLQSILFANARVLAGASTLARSDAGRHRAAFEVCVHELPRHWGYLVCTDTVGLAGALESMAPSPQEIELALQSGWIDEEFAEHLTHPLRIDVNAPSDGTLLFARDTMVTVEGPLWQAWLGAHLARTWLELPSTVATRAARLTLAAGRMGVIDASSCAVLEPVLATRIARAAHVGGIRATQSAVAASRAGIKLRVTKPPEALSLAEEVDVVRDAGWTFRSTAVGAVAHLGPGDDEEETLADLQRHGLQAAEWASRSLAHPHAGLGLRVDLVAIEEDGTWAARLGAIPDITATPGRKLVVRYFDRTGQPIADVMHGVSERILPAEEAMLIGHLEVPSSIPIIGATSSRPVLEPLMRSGRAVGPPDSMVKAKANVRAALDALPAAYARLRHPARFPVGLTHALAALKADLVAFHAC
jgi:hypothetical protein